MKNVTKQINVTRREITSNDNLRPRDITLYVLRERKHPSETSGYS